MTPSARLHLARSRRGPIPQRCRAPRFNSQGSWSVRSSSAAALDGQPSSLSASLHSGREGSLNPSVSGELRTGQEFQHTPAMLDEVLELFEDFDEGTILDATLGGGGHAAAILESHPRLRLVGIDRDAAAIAAATERLARFGDRVRIVRARFDELGSIVRREVEPEPLVGVLFDLGVSTAQLDAPDRGFSFRFDGPLDMRMDTRGGRTAGDLVNSLDAADLEDLLREHGEAKFARRIAKAIVGARPILGTAQLAEIVADAVPAAARRRGHPARRVFQALRVEVNDELSILPGAIDDAIEATRVGGRIVVLAYHSGEDRIVKERFSFAATGGCTCPPGLPCVCGALAVAKLLTRGARLPSEAEVAENPRAEAARLRAVERIEPAPARRSR